MKDSVKTIRVPTFLLSSAFALIFLTSSVHGQTFQVLHTFRAKADGAYPFGGVAVDGVGNLYGLTSTTGVGVYNRGTLYKIDSSGKFSVLRELAQHDGCLSFASVLLDKGGNLYGTTSECGSDTLGTAFEYQTSSGKFIVLHSFGGVDVAKPLAGLIRDDLGNLYGTGNFGGNCCWGGVFKIDHQTGVETVLYNFGQEPDGESPNASVVRDAQGNLYGTTSLGGPGGVYGYGTVYKLDPSGTETLLYTFSGGADGANPIGGLVRDSSGNLYGTTAEGGLSKAPGGYGTLFKIDSSGTFTVLHTFGTFLGDAAISWASLITDGKGNLYGTSEYGGRTGNGTVFKSDLNGNVTILHSFTRGSDGAFPFDQLAIDTAGNLYGTTNHGGAGTCDCGVVFKITP